MLFKKEDKVENLMREHLGQVAEAVNHLREVVLAYLEKNISLCEKKTQLIEKEETQADEIKKEAELALYEGAYLPIFREDLLNLLELMDDIIDEAERVGDFLVIESPRIPQKFQDQIRQIIEENIRTFNIFQESFLLMYENTDRAFTRAQEVKTSEKRVDEMQDNLMKEVFGSDLELAQKIHLRDLIIRIGFISDSSENVSDKIRVMAVKKQI